MLKKRVRKLERIAFFDALTRLVYSREDIFVQRLRKYSSWSYLFVEIGNCESENTLFGRCCANMSQKRVIVILLRRLRLGTYPFIMLRSDCSGEVGAILLGAPESAAVLVAKDLCLTVVSDRCMKQKGITLHIDVSGIEFGNGKFDRRSVSREIFKPQKYSNSIFPEIVKSIGVSRWGGCT